MTDVENKSMDVEEFQNKSHEKLKDIRRESNKMMKAAMRLKDQESVTLPMLDAFGKEKAKTGFGAMNRHQRRSAKKRAKMMEKKSN